MTNEAKTDTKTTETTTPAASTTDNKAIFGPLGKYAAIAVIMVSIIVTTAIMLNKQLGSVNEQIAVIENEVAELNVVASSSPATQNDTAITVEADISTSEVTPAVTEETQAEVVATNAAPASEQNVTEGAAQTPAIEVAAIESTTTNTEAPVVEVQQQEVQTQARQSASTKSEARQAQLAAESKARIEAFKLEQKQRMSEMFARIKTLEAQQLEQYKASQDKRVERLRSQIAQQQQVIDALILRNEESLKMREASVQKHQASREQVLNRI